MPCPSAAYGPRCGAGGGQLYRSTSGQVLVSAEEVKFTVPSGWTIKPNDGTDSGALAVLQPTDNAQKLPPTKNWVPLRLQNATAGQTAQLPALEFYAVIG